MGALKIAAIPAAAPLANRSNATLIATVDNATNVEFLIGEFGNRFFWIRHKRIHRGKANTQKILRGAYVPSSATGGQQGVSKLMNPSFGFDVGASFIKFDSAGALSPTGTDQDTTFTVVKRGLTGTPTIQLLDADGTTRSGNSAFTDGSQSISGNSATVDANSLSYTYTMPSASFGTVEAVTLGRISDNSKVVSVLVEVLTPLTGYAGGPNNLVPLLEVGTQADPDRFMTVDQNDVESSGSYTTTPDFHYSGATELDIKVSLEHLNATAGEIKVTVTYV